MKKSLLKSLFVLFAFVAGVNVAVADEITATLSHTAGTQWGSNTGANTVDAEKEHYNNDAASSWAGAAYAEFAFEISEGQVVTKAELTYSVNQGGKSGRNDIIYYMAEGFTLDYAAIPTLTGDQRNTASRAGKAVESAPTGGKGDRLNLKQDVTDAVKAIAATGQKYIIFQWTGNAGGADLYGKASANAPVLVITTASASAMTSYTVKFVDAAGVELKAAVQYDIMTGETGTASAEDLAAFYNDDKTKKYIYESGNANIVTVADATANVITLTFREAAIYNYTINASVNGQTIEVSKGQTFEADEVLYNYPRFVNVDGTLWEAAKGATGYYQNKFTASTDAHVETVSSYTATANTGVVYYSEAEDIDGMTIAPEVNAPIRMSMGTIARNAGTEDLTITTLPAGKYKIMSSVWGSKTTDFNFKAGENTVYTITTTGSSVTTTSEEFSVLAATDIKLGATESSTRGIDFVAIMKTGDVEVAPAEPIEALFNWSDSTNVNYSGKDDRVFTVEGVTLTTTLGTHTNNAPAINKAGEIRFYAGNAMTIVAPEGMNIGRVSFTAGSYDNGAGAEKLTYNGTAISSVWTLDTPANTVELSAAAKCSFKKITVVCVAEGQTLPDYVPVVVPANTVETAYSIAKAQELLAAADDNSAWVYVKGFVTSVDPNGAFNAQYGNLNYYIADAKGDTENHIQVYRGFGVDSVKFASADELSVDDEVVVYGQLTYYKNEMQIGQYSKIAAITKAPKENTPVSYEAIDIKALCAETTDIVADATFTAATGDFTWTVTTSGDEAKVNQWYNMYGFNFYLKMFGGTITFKAAEGKYLDQIAFPGSPTVIPANVTVSNGTLVQLGYDGDNKAVWTAEGQPTEVTFTITGAAAVQVYGIQVGTKPLNEVKAIADLANYADEDRINLTLTDAYAAYYDEAEDEIFIADATGYIKVKGTALNVTAGKGITGNIVGELDVDNWNTLSLIGDANTAAGSSVTATEADYTPAYVTDIEDVTAYKNALVTLGKVYLSWSAENQVGKVFQGNSSYTMSDKFVKFESMPEFADSITGILYSNGSRVEFYPTDAKVKAGVIPFVDHAGFAGLDTLENNTYVNLTLTDAVVTAAADVVDVDTEAATFVAFAQDANAGVRMNNINLESVASGKKLNGTLKAKVVISYGNLVLEGISQTSESAITAEDCVVAAEVVENIFETEGNYTNKLVTLLDMDIQNDYGTYYISKKDADGEELGYMNMEDLFGLTADGTFSFPKKALKITGIVSGSSSSPYFYPVSKDSIVAAAVIVKEINNIAELKAMTTNADVKLHLNDVKVTVAQPSRMGGFAFIMEDTVAIQIEESGWETFSFPEELKVAGQVVNGILYGTATYDEWMGSVMFTASDSTAARSVINVSDKACEPTAMTIAEAKDMKNALRYVKIEKPELKNNEGIYMVYADGDSIDFYDIYEAWAYDTISVETDPDTGEFWYAETEMIVHESGYNWIAGIVSNDGWTTMLMPLAYDTISVSTGDDDTNVIYSWESPEGTVVEKGGKAAMAGDPDGQDRLNYANADYYTICLRGKKGNIDDAEASSSASHLVITLDNALEKGNVISITAYRNKDQVGKAATIYFDYGTVQVSDDKEYGNIHEVEGGSVTTHNYDIPEAAVGQNVIRMTRNDANTNLFITKIEVLRSGVADGISDVNAVVNILNGNVYSINGQMVRKAGQGLDGLKGLYIINGKKVVIK